MAAVAQVSATFLHPGYLLTTLVRIFRMRRTRWYVDPTFYPDLQRLQLDDGILRGLTRHQYVYSAIRESQLHVLSR